MNQLNIAIGLITVLSIVGAVAFIGSLLLSKYYSLRTGRKPFDKLITKLQPVGQQIKKFFQSAGDKIKNCLHKSKNSAENE